MSNLELYISYITILVLIGLFFIDPQFKESVTQQYLGYSYGSTSNSNHIKEQPTGASMKDCMPGGK